MVLAPLSPLRIAGGTHVDSSDETDWLLVMLSSDNSTWQGTNRFKRARERKKQELEQVRKEAAELEKTLTELKEHHRSKVAMAIKKRHDTNANVVIGLDSAAWDAMAEAVRQKQERLQAEFFNQQLKLMVDAALRQTRVLEARLQSPSGHKVITRHKRFRKPRGPRNPLQDAVAVHNLLVEVDQLQGELRFVWENFGVTPSETAFNDINQRTSGCGFTIEALDCRSVPYEIEAVSESMWRFAAFEDGRGDSQSDERGETVARSYDLNIVNGSFRGSYIGRGVFRRLLCDDLVLISWASSWTLADLESNRPDMHEAMSRQGIIAVQRCPNHPEQVSIVHSFNRTRRDSCGKAHCQKGGMGALDFENLMANSSGCMQHTAPRLFNGMENLMLSEQTSVRRKSKEVYCVA